MTTNNAYFFISYLKTRLECSTFVESTQKNTNTWPLQQVFFFFLSSMVCDCLDAKKEGKKKNQMKEKKPKRKSKLRMREKEKEIGDE
jgi:hypothetical protein